MVSLIEAHFFGTESQSSIYGLTKLPGGENSNNKVLVASSNRKVYCIEYSKSQSDVIFSTREVQFTYIPGRAEIIGIDAFNQACHIHDFVVGITFVKTDTSGKQNPYFNIYSDWEPSTECDLDNIAQGCLSISLDFIPFHLTHCELTLDGEAEMVWLLSGNDERVHLYRENKVQQNFSEIDSKVCFPELEHVPSVVMWMDFMTTPETRISAFGCKDASILVANVSLLPETRLVASWDILHDGVVSCVKLFRESDLCNTLTERALSSEQKAEQEKVHLWVGNMIETSVVYREVLKYGLDLDHQRELPESCRFDVVNCGIVADIDMDGDNELILGTYGQMLLVYKYLKAEDRFEMFHRQMLPNPILALDYLDLVGDGPRELIVLTIKGLHIFQHDPKEIARLCASRMEWLFKNLTKEETEQFLKTQREKDS